jgi:hypothetical protein
MADRPQPTDRPLVKHEVEFSKGRLKETDLNEFNRPVG